MEVIPQIFNGKVMHKRLFPKANQFAYGIYYLALPLSMLKKSCTTDVLPVNRPGFINFQEKDHGQRDGSDLGAWLSKIVADYQLQDHVDNVVLITMPRILGYGFNPVSFWFCLDSAKNIRAVLCEVNNTFGETHSYLCFHDDKRPILQNDWMFAEKLFHVSPFLERQGHYRFRFAHNANKLSIWIDYCDRNNNKQLLTSLIGSLSPLTRKNLLRAAWAYPLVTLRALTLIHWQALKLLCKGIRYKNKPEQIARKLTRSHHAAPESVLDAAPVMHKPFRDQ